MNLALRAKWCWRYGQEGNDLWKSIIESKYGGGDQNWWPRSVSMSYGKAFWKGIMNSYPKFKENISCRLGDGNRVRFWLDVWVGSETLKMRFPYIFIVSNNKLGVVSSMGTKLEQILHGAFSLGGAFMIGNMRS
ncbi:hypothetical protein FRX31_026231 [Thalictrum thalictroides]|uniref:Uncharacterized protein n=1 Tax=Thalictrum thalictroides TaxID=46969 RepID=A0A7J6VH07_THATH|nr:hypothetical protein FRX31_026231 [Thalictrum thalictroides]